MQFEIGKYYYNNLVLIKVTDVDGKDISLRGYDEPISSDLLILMGYYLLPIENPEGDSSFKLKMRK